MTSGKFESLKGGEESKRVDQKRCETYFLVIRSRKTPLDLRTIQDGSCGLVFCRAVAKDIEQKAVRFEDTACLYGRFSQRFFCLCR